jgi:enoyl-CoA hydratase
MTPLNSQVEDSAMGQEPIILTNKSNGIGEIVLNRPAQRNALNTAMCVALLAAVNDMELDAELRVVMVRASGPVFCAGADLKERQEMDADAVRARRLKAFAVYDAIESLSKPCIAIVDGPVIGSGGEIAASCDFIIASERASFRYPEAVWGSVGATQRLPRIIGKPFTKELMFSGREMPAQEARAVGLVNRVVAVDELDATARALAAQIAAAPADALRLAKRCIDRGMETDRRGALGIELAAIEEMLTQTDWKQGIAAFGKRSKGQA